MRPTPPCPMHTLSMDFKGKLRGTTSGMHYLLVVTCLCTRFIWAIPCANQETITVAKALLSIFDVFGCCSYLISDNAANFVSEVMREVCRLCGI